MEPDPTPLPKLDGWLRARWPRVFFGVLALAVLLRVLVFVELHDSPVFAAHLHDQMDTKFFTDSAMYVVEEDALCGRQPIHPLHRWHVFIAEEYFQAHPEELPAPYTGRPFAKVPKDVRNRIVWLKWQDWYGGTRFHQEPLYVYFLAFVYSIFGENVPLIYVLQMLIGVCTIGLTMAFARRVFGHVVAAVAGMLLVFWGPMMHFELTLLRATLITFFGMALLHASLRIGEEGERPKRLRSFFAYGLLVGLATAMKTTFLLFGVGLVLALAWQLRADRARIGRVLGVVLAGALVPLVLIFVRNAAVGAPLFSMTSVGPVTFAGTNLPSFEPWWGWLPYPEAKTLSEIMHVANGEFLATVSETVAQHDGFFSWLGLLGTKFLWIWHWYEIPNNTNFYYHSLHSHVLTATQYLVGAAWVMPFAFVGIVATWRRRGVRIGWWYLICAIGPLVVFYTLSRLRVPLMVGLMPFAAAGLVSVIDWIARRKWIPAGLGILAFSALVVFVRRELPRPVITATDHQNGWVLHYGPRVEAHTKAGDLRAVVAIYERYLGMAPGFVFAIEPGYRVQNDYQAEISYNYRTTLREAAAVHQQLGNAAQAARYADYAQRHAGAIEGYRSK